MRGWRAAAGGLVAALLAVASGADAASVVSGTIQSDTTWRAQDGPFDVAADVTVAGGATLTIEAGVTVHMRAGVNLSVEQGALRALGTAAQPVVITSVRDQTGDTPAPGDWGTLRFLAGTIGAATLLERVEIRYGSGLALEQASATFNYVTVAGHSGPAIAIDLRSSLHGSSGIPSMACCVRSVSRFRDRPRTICWPRATATASWTSSWNAASTSRPVSSPMTRSCACSGSKAKAPSRKSTPWTRSTTESPIRTYPAAGSTTRAIA